MALLSHIQGKEKKLEIIDLDWIYSIHSTQLSKPIAIFLIFRPSTPDFSQVTTGDLQWLDGITEDNTKNDFVTGLVIDHSALHTVYLSNKIWNHFTTT